LSQLGKDATRGKGERKREGTHVGDEVETLVESRSFGSFIPESKRRGARDDQFM